MMQVIQVSWRESQVVKDHLTVNKDKDAQELTYFDYVQLHFRRIWHDFLQAYSSMALLKWSIWWAFATCGFYQIGNYTQSLWQLIQSDYGQPDYNGATEAINTALGTIFVFFIQFVDIKWEKWGEILLGIGTGIDCVLLLIMSQTRNIFICYTLYIVYRVLYMINITIIQYNIAKKLKSQSFGLIFGLNSFIALLLQTILTVIVAEKGGLHLKIRDQFIVYGVYHGVIAMVFIVMGAITLYRVYQPRPVVNSSDENNTTEIS